MAQPATAIAHDIAQSVKRFEASILAQANTSSTATGIHVSQFNTSQIGRLSRGAHRNANVAQQQRLAFRPGVMIMDGKIELHFNIYDESNVNRL